MSRWIALTTLVLLNLPAKPHTRQLFVDQFHGNPTVRLLEMEALNDSETVVMGTFTDTMKVLNDGRQLETYVQKGTYPSVFIAKLNSKFLFKGVAVIDGEGILTPGSMTVSGHQIFIAGSFSVTHTIDFDPGLGESKRSSNTASHDIFLLELNDDLSFKQVMTLGGPSRVNGGDKLEGLAITPSGSFILAGTFHGTTDFDPGTGTTNLTSAANERDVFIARYNRKMQLEWAGQLTGTSYKGCSSLALDSAQNIVMAGAFRGSVDFDPGASQRFMSAGTLYNNGYVLSLDSTGAYRWAIQQKTQAYSGNSEVVAQETIVVFGTAGDDVVLGKNSSDTLRFPANEQSHYMMQLDLGGNVVAKERMKTTMGFLITDVEKRGNRLDLAIRYYHDLRLGLGSRGLRQVSNNTYNTALATYNLKTRTWTGLRSLSSGGVDGDLVLSGGSATRFGCLVGGSTLHILPDTSVYKVPSAPSLAFGRLDVVCQDDTAKQDYAICQGDSLSVNGTQYHQGGIYLQQLVGSYGCDSFLNLTVKEHPVFHVSDSLHLCPYDSVNYQGTYYSASGNHLLQLYTTQGCDSTVSLQVYQPQVDTAVLHQGGRLVADTKADSIHWYKCSNPHVVLSDSFVFEPTSTGNYQFTKWIQGCGVKSACVNHVRVGFANWPGEGSARLENGRVVFSELMAHATVYNAYGQVVKVVSAVNSFDSTPLAQGIYLIVYETQQGELFIAKMRI